MPGDSQRFGQAPFRYFFASSSYADSSTPASVIRALI
jgi:hypothetical protein